MYPMLTILRWSSTATAPAFLLAQVDLVAACLAKLIAHVSKSRARSSGMLLFVLLTIKHLLRPPSSILGLFIDFLTPEAAFIALVEVTVFTMVEEFTSEVFFLEYFTRDKEILSRVMGVFNKDVDVVPEV